MMGAPSGYLYSRLSCAAPAALPGRRVTVVLADMGMSRMMGGPAPLGVHMMLATMPATAPAGTVTLVAQNLGWRDHELVVLPLAPGQSAGQREVGTDGRVDEAGSLGEASADCAAGGGEGIPAGAASWVTLTLPAGRYELVCNLPNHYADGMYAMLTVT
jgi:uncharacterized cupredoxin-like copper-binding protein